MRTRHNHLALLLALLISLGGRAESFTNPYRIPTSGNPTGVAVADINGDGLLDIVYGDNSASPQLVHVLLAQPGGGYVAAPNVTLPANVGSACRLFDTNQDHKPDLVCGYSSTFSASIVVFLGNGDGTFGSPLYFALPTSNANYFYLSFTMPMDLNSDGIPDIIANDEINYRSYVLLGDGHGSFKLASTLSNWINSPVAIDVNGDGKPDLLGSEGPYVALGNGDGTFGPIKSYSQTFDYDNECTYADMDGDGHVDAVCGYTEAPNGDIDGATHLIILRGNPDGSFNPTPILDQKFGNYDNQYDGEGTFLYPITVRDLNGDGILDIISTSGDGYGVLFGQTGLTFAAPLHYAAGPIASANSYTAVFADMNGDGLIDIVSAATNGVYISFGEKNGSFATARAFEVAQVLNNAAFADFNGDGVPDIAATGDTTIQLSFGMGDGTFAPFIPLANNGVNFTGQYPSSGASIFAGDFNGDGKKDIFASGAPSLFVQSDYIYFGLGDGTFNPATLVPNSTSMPGFPTPGVFVADVNKDGLDDIVSADTFTSTLAGQSPHIYVSLSNGDGSFRTVTTTVPAEQVNSAFNAKITPPALADFNHDGKLDAVVGELSNVYVLKGHGDGSFDSTGTVLPLPAASSGGYLGSYAVATGDFDGDGNPDIAIIGFLNDNNPASVAVYVYYGHGDGTFSTPATAGTFAHEYSQITTADLNGDGLTDIVLTNPYQLYDTASIAILHAQAGRTFAPQVNYLGGSGLHQCAILDVNKDGLPDLLFANNLISGTVANSVTVLLNESNTPSVTGTLTASPEPSAFGQTFTLTASLHPPSPATLAGSITFSIDGVVVGSAPLSSNVATISISTPLAVGTHSLTATWPGDTTYPALSLSGTHTITGLATTTALTPSLNPSPFGQSVTFTAIVTNTSTTSGSPTGSIVFSDGTTVVLTAPLTSASGNTATASFSTANLTVGAHTITAAYAPTGVFSSSTANLNETINALASSTTLTAAPNPALFGQPVTLTAAVTGASTTPTGSLTFYDGLTLLTTVPLDAAGHAAFTISTLAVGTHSLTAVYAGNAVYTTSTSPAFLETINPLPVDFTITLAAPTVTLKTQHHLTTSLTLASLNSFADSLALICSNLPTYVTCQPKPTPATLTANATATISLYLDTDSVLGYARLHSAPPLRPTPSPINLALLLSPFGLFAVLATRRRTRFRLLALLLAAIPLSIALTGCGEIITPFDPPPSATPGTYTIPIVATGSVTGITHSTNLTLIVTP